MNEPDHKDLDINEAVGSEQKASEDVKPAAGQDNGTILSDDANEINQGTAEEPDGESSLQLTDVTEGSSESGSDEVDPAVEQVSEEPVRDTSHLSWYVVHTYSGYENKARLALEDRIKRDGLENEFGEILVPTEEVVEMTRGKRRTSKRKFFPGYMLVQMNMTENTWYLVKSTPKITGFVGNATKPLPVPDAEIRRISNQMAEGADRLRPKIIFEKGDAVRVVDGPFANFNGTIDDVDPEKGKLRVLVSIFGRATPVEMDFVQVEKT